MIASMAAGRRGALGKLLAASGLPRSTYYFELRKADADGKNSELFELIGRIFARHRGNYGVRRVHRALLALGVAINHKKVQRIMRKLGLSARKHPRRYHSYQGHVGAVAGNLIRRDFGADRPNRKWTTDVSQFSLPWGKCYLSPVMDMYNNEIVGYDLSTRADYAQIERMLASAGVGSRDLAGLTIHSDWISIATEICNAIICIAKRDYD